MIDDLTRLANRIRQQTITRELSDIVGTSEALAG
jgi:F0F1-type ATP synthase gamma subunit